MLKLAAVLAGTALVGAPAMAQTQTYTFMGYVACQKGQLGCTQWPEAPHPWVVMTFGNGLSYASCLNFQTNSRALTGAGFCDPYIK